MTEIDGIIGIYGAIDEAVQARRGIRAQVARLLPLYNDPDLHWYEDFETWLKREKGVAEDAEPLFPELPQALSQLAGIPPECRMRARRMFAIAVAARAFPAMRKQDSELQNLAVRALSVDKLAAEGKNAEKLFALLSDDDHLARASGAGTHELGAWWDHVIGTALNQGLISGTTGCIRGPARAGWSRCPGATAWPLP